MDKEEKSVKTGKALMGLGCGIMLALAGLVILGIVVLLILSVL